MDELSIEQLEELKADLFELRNQLRKMLEQSIDSAQTVTLDQQAFGRVSRIDAIQQQSMAQASKSNGQETLRRVLKALARIESGDYGYCLECDEVIGYPRLKARPETALCLKCQSERENV